MTPTGYSVEVRWFQSTRHHRVRTHAVDLSKRASVGFLCRPREVGISVHLIIKACAVQRFTRKEHQMRSPRALCFSGGQPGNQSTYYGDGCIEPVFEQSASASTATAFIGNTIRISLQKFLHIPSPHGALRLGMILRVLASGFYLHVLPKNLSHARALAQRSWRVLKNLPP
jgi:hypothetical protein